MYRIYTVLIEHSQIRSKQYVDNMTTVIFFQSRVPSYQQ